MHQKENVPNVAVLLAAYNGAEWISQQISSILKQENVNIKIFVSIDRSTDDTGQIVSRISNADSRVMVISSTERFGNAARNFFFLMSEVQVSEFDYISFSDQDDIWLDNKLSHAVRVMAEKSVDAYSSDVIAFWASGAEMVVRKSQGQKKWDFIFEAAGPGCTYVLSRKLAIALQKNIKENWCVMQKVGAHDWYFYAFARANEYRWFIDNYAGMLYRQHDRNQVGVNLGWRAFEARARQVLGGQWIDQAALIATLVGLNSSAVVTRWSSHKRAGFFWLATHARNFRRRPRDWISFLVFCLILSITGPLTCLDRSR